MEVENSRYRILYGYIICIKEYSWRLHTKNDNFYPFGTKSGQFVHMGSMLKSSLESTCSVDKFSQKSDARIDAERSLTCLDR